eukprot:SAG22_NODE_6135_length_894_cov_0.860377_1_plen_121_part_10
MSSMRLGAADVAAHACQQRQRQQRQRHSALVELCQELCGLLIRSLPGHPASGRRWTQARDAWILEFFNSNAWTGWQLIYDPCWFVLHAPDHSVAAPRRVWLLVHSDGVRCAADPLHSASLK